MARRIIDPQGTAWRVALSGRSTMYGRDELSLEFRPVESPTQVRYCRYSPRGAKAGELALDESTDRELLALLASAQPAWTSPDGDYGQT
ncbi:MAG: hypothetical protein KA267_02315 [Gemmatimonadales bacterium]|jgi:hypothetical protein|nr:hypothetical protein [Gemmatimonadota bacterium]MBP6442830.1 hypothetical protein [Gemmatimonadales bacterium]MBP6571109.1 hypothetical protein [Gemmatimonadales bacterium]MBP7620982.1 hypothetical protein [Gemmatimonadales bacterium]MBP9898826.1 hypothetical protein [Gemmatimonadales bacterium]